MGQVKNLELLATAIEQVNSFFVDKVQKQVNSALTLRNWIIGFYIVEYEQHGEDRAEYGGRLYEKLATRIKATRIKAMGIKGLSLTSLHLCKQLYLTYPQIIHAVTEQFQQIDFRGIKILQSVTEESDQVKNTPPELLLNSLSFTHIVELIKNETHLKRVFCETEAIRNNWSVRELQRAINSMLLSAQG